MNPLPAADPTFGLLDAVTLTLATSALPLVHAVAILVTLVLPAAFRRTNVTPARSRVKLAIRCWSMVGLTAYLAVGVFPLVGSGSVGVTLIFALALACPLLATVGSNAGVSSWRVWAAQDSELGQLADVELDQLANRLFLRTFAQRVHVSSWLTAAAMLL